MLRQDFSAFACKGFGKGVQLQCPSACKCRSLRGIFERSHYQAAAFGTEVKEWRRRLEARREAVFNENYKAPSVGYCVIADSPFGLADEGRGENSAAADCFQPCPFAVSEFLRSKTARHSHRLNAYFQ